MARTRAQNKKDNTVTEHTALLTEGQRVFISWLIVQNQGLDRDGSRKVGALIDRLDLEELNVREIDDFEQVYEWVLSGYEIRFLLDELDRLWTEKKVPPQHAKNSIKTYDYFKDILDGRTEAPPAE